MKKKNLKTLRLTKSTISSLHTQTISGGTNPISIIIIRTTQQATATGCSQLMECDSIIACPQTVLKTQLKNTETRPIC